MTLHQGLKWHLKWGEQDRFEDSPFFLLIPPTPKFCILWDEGKSFDCNCYCFTVFNQNWCKMFRNSSQSNGFLYIGMKCFSPGHEEKLHMVWRGFEVPHSNQSPPPVIQGSKTPFSVSILHSLGLIASNKAK